MASSSSLQPSCNVAPTTTASRRIPPSSKPSQLLMNGRRTHRFHVSCSAGGGGRGGGSIDRRNMLLGMGGLYGASSLISDPNAKAADAPVEAPDFSKCDTEGAFTGSSHLDVNCCPPFSDTVNDYVLPTSIIPKVRPAAHTVDADYIAKYELAMQRMRNLDKTDPDDPRGFTQQANIHCAYCNGPHDQIGYPGVDVKVHFSWLFFPFHRWYLYFYERILGELINDPTFALPYWNWDNPPGMEMPPMFDNRASPLYDCLRNPLHVRPAVVDLPYSQATNYGQLVENNLAQMYKEMISSPTSAEDFMGFKMVAGQPNSQGGSSENGSHTSIHRWVGDPDQDFNENMGNFYSAGRDPMFYSHHANVDRMWTIWETIPADYPKQIDDDLFRDASFHFYNEKKELVRVKVGDCLDYTKMGYTYQPAPTPWRNFRPPARSAPVVLQDISQGVPTVDKALPITLTNSTFKVLVKKPTKGKADELLVLSEISFDPTQYIKFDVFINDEDDDPSTKINKAEYAGTFSQLPHRTKTTGGTTSVSFGLRDLYEDIDIADDDSVVVTIVPRADGAPVTIGGINIVSITRS